MKNKKLTRNDKRRNLIIKWLLLSLFMCLSYLLCTSGTEGFVKPLTIIPLALCIAMYERLEIIAASVGGLCGLILDSACGRTFGFNGFLMTVFSLGTALLFLYLLRRTFINIMLICTGVTVLHELLDYLFFYAIWSYDNKGYIFLHLTLPSLIFTLISCPIVFILVYLVNRKFGEQEEYFLNEQSEDIVRE